MLLNFRNILFLAHTVQSNIPEVKFIEDAQKSDRLRANEVEIETVSKNVKHCAQNIPKYSTNYIEYLRACIFYSQQNKRA